MKMIEKRRVVITGVGVVSPVGTGCEKFWGALVKGQSGIDTITHFDPSQFSCKIAGMVRDVDLLQHFNSKEDRVLAKFTKYAVISSREALAMSRLNLSKVDLDRMGVLIGSGIGSLNTLEVEYQKLRDRGPGKISPFFIPKIIINEASGQVSIDTGARALATCVVTACATGTNAIGDALRFIQYGDADIIIAGGTESAVTELGIGGFCACKALSKRNDEPQRASRPFDLDRDGFIMGEGAGVVILESLDHALKRGATILAELSGYGRTSDAFHATAPEPTGKGAAKSMDLAIKDAELTPQDIQYINAHGTSTKLNDKGETLAIKQVFGDHAKKVPVSSTKSMTGHLLGAAGGIEFAACVFAIRDGIIPPTINYETPDPDCDLDYVPNTARKAELSAVMTNSLGFGGHNASMVITQYKD